jgi:hypothetical protein
MKTNEQLKAENKAIRDILATGVEDRLLSIPGVIHVSVGLKEKSGQVTDELCIRVYVGEKKDSENVPAAELVPIEIDGIPTDVNMVGEFEFQSDNTRYRPIKGGIQITNRIIALNDKGTRTQISRGTLGCVAIDNTDNAPVLLSNWHVLFANTGTVGSRIFQPAPTSLPQPTMLQVPLQPTDDSNLIGIIRRSAITTKVDGAIAAIDISSCCHCCGIHYSNEINGLSVGGRPARNTIVGEERAVSGMTVFKVGQKTLRSEGVVVDDNYPSFSINRDGVTYTFVGQIAILNVNNALPFSDSGDSGSVVINLSNKIVGLVFASGKAVPVKGIEKPFVSLANHISDVFSALNIRIKYSPDVVAISGEILMDVPPDILEAPIPEPYRLLRERLQRHKNTAKLFALGQHHSEEVTYLINHCRPVAVAWQRCKGPALLATVMNSIRDGHYQLPSTIKGVYLDEVLERMRTALRQHGSPALIAVLSHSETDLIIEAWKGCSDLNKVIENIAVNQSLNSFLQDVSI